MLSFLETLEKLINHPKIGVAATRDLVTEHAGNAAQITALAIILINCAIGKHLEAVTSLAVMSICLLDQRGKLPEKVAITFNKHLTPLAYACGLVAGSGWQRVITGISLIISIMPFAFHLIQDKADQFVAERLEKQGIRYPLMKELSLPYTPSAGITADEVKNFSSSLKDRTCSPPSFVGR